MILDSTVRKLQVLLAGAIATNNLPVVVDAVDFTNTTTTPVPTMNNTNGVTAVDIVPAPAASTQRKINMISVFNADTASATVTIRYNDNGTTYIIFKGTLAVGDMLFYTDTAGWFIVDSSGGMKVASSSGRWLKTTVLTAGTTFTSGPATNSIFVRMVGGGGGGGGCTSVAAAAAAGGGGGGGGYAEKTFTVTPNTNYTYAIGSAGTGVSGAAGNNGGNSTFAVGATTVTANGGGGGPLATAVTNPVTYQGGAGGAVSTNGDVNSAGQPGEEGSIIVVATPVGYGGNGGSSPFGAGGRNIVAAGNGNNGIGFGAGGGGSLTGASAARTGGNGTAGVIVVDEFA